VVQAVWVFVAAMAAVPHPWTPVKVDGAVVSVWGRSHNIGPNGLPARIVSNKTELLARPVTLEIDGRPIVTDAECRFETSSLESARWHARAHSGDLDYSCNGLAEFDGMLRFDVEMTPRRPVSLRRLSLCIPLHREQATLLHFYPPLYDYPKMTWFKPDRPNSMARPAKWGCRFTPFVWLGNEDRGLQWFCESDEGWKSDRPESVIELAEEGAEVVLRIHFFDTAATLDRPFRVTFGLMAGPVKPGPTTFAPPTLRYSHWATYGMADPQPGSNPPTTGLDRLKGLGVKFVGMHEDWTDFEGMPRATQPEKLHRLVEEAHRRGMGLVLYHAMFVPDIAPEHAAMAEECRCEPTSAYYVHSREPRQFDYPVCYRSRWSELFTSGIERLFSEYHIDGLYLDGAASPIHCANARHRCGYLDASGQRRPTFTIFAAREQMKRLRAICDAQGRPTIIVAHMSAMVTLPTLSFADVLLTGEQYWKAPADFRPSLEFFRTECMGHPHGLPTHFIGYPPLGGPWATTMTALHSAPSPWCPDGLEMWKLQDHFDVEHAEWFPYWSPQRLASTDRPEVLVSGFRRQRAVLLAAGNTSARPVRVHLQLNERLLGPAIGTLPMKDAVTGKELPSEAAGLRLELKPETTQWILCEIAGTPDR
jgi:hypothetical protein